MILQLPLQSLLMKLDVLTKTQPWYADGLDFTCSQCGNCCTGSPGYVHLTREEVRRLSQYLRLTPKQVIERYCRKVGARLSLKEKRGRGGWDCIFLKEIESTRRPQGADREISGVKRICSIYPVRPLQCRTWPFWDGNLASRRSWESASRRCPGMNAPGRRFSRDQIEALRDAKDWPVSPPGSASTERDR